MLYDKDIREPLFDFLEEVFGKIRIIEEKQMGKSRADIVMVMPEAIAGIEIKSDADTYARLGRQIADYDQYFDYNYIVAGTRHAMHVEAHVPDWWGIITVEMMEGIPDFYILRRAARNPEMKLQKKLRLLWRPELAHIQELCQMPGYKQKSKDFVIEKIAGRIPEAVLHKQISDELFERDYTEIAETIRNYKKNNLVKTRRRPSPKRRHTKRNP